MANEKRMIDANALIGKFEMETNDMNDLYFHLDEIIDEIMKAPAVDAVEVVRCKGCMYRYFNKAHDKYLCSNRNGLTSRLDDGFFCSYGERKGNEV